MSYAQVPGTLDSMIGGKSARGFVVDMPEAVGVLAMVRGARRGREEGMGGQVVGLEVGTTKAAAREAKAREAKRTAARPRSTRVWCIWVLWLCWEGVGGVGLRCAVWVVVEWCCEKRAKRGGYWPMCRFHVFVFLVLFVNALFCRL